MYDKKIVEEATLDYFEGDELATNVFITKYLLRDNDGNFLEKTPADMHRRLAREFARVEKIKYDGTEMKPLTEDELFKYFDKFKYIIPQGSPMFGIGNNYQMASLSNCFVLSTPADSYAGIMRTDEELVQISKRRGGVGIDLSDLRPEGCATHNAAKSSTGILSFMERYSNSIREVGQEGRRGALMISLDCKHPSIEDFVTSKVDLTKITGANISVKLSNEFLLAVQNDTDFELCFPVDYKEKGIQPIVTKNIKAKDLWEKIIHTSWLTAEPGILFWDNLLDYSPTTSYPEFTAVSTNPCVIGRTLVLTNYGWFKISNLENIQKDQPNLRIITQDANGVLHESILEKTWLTVENSDIYKLTYKSNLTGEENTIEVSPDHKFYNTDMSEIVITDIKNGDILVGGSAIGAGEMIVIDITLLDEKEDVWDLTANPNYNFFSIDKPHQIENNNGEEIPYFSIVEEDGVNKFYYDTVDVTVPNIVYEYINNSILSVDCAEIALPAYDSCRLITINLYSYVENPFTENAKFDYDKYFEHVKIAQRLMDDLIDLEVDACDMIINKIENDPEIQELKDRESIIWKKIKDKALQGRRTGLGVTSVADMLAALNVGYGTNESIKIIDEVFKTHMLGSYTSSVEMSKILGAFPCYDSELEKDNKFILRIKETNPELYLDMIKYGRRNIACNTCSPNGSTSILAQRSSGVEPLFMMEYNRRRKLDTSSTETPDYTDDMGDRWIYFNVKHNTIDEWTKTIGETDISKSPWAGFTSPEIDWKKRVELQATAQKYIDHSISSTINLPETATVDDIRDIYEEAWKLGCKGVTVYRDKCRVGILSSEQEKNDDFKIIDATKRPKILSGNVHHLTFQGERYYVVVGLWGNKQPYEIFVGKNINIETDELYIPKSITGGKIKKIKRGYYILIDKYDNEYPLAGELYNDVMESTTRLVSLSLRQGSDISFIVQVLERSKGDMYSFSKVIARTLKKYIEDGSEVHGEICPECGSDKLIREGGCIVCVNCGYSKCE